MNYIKNNKITAILSFIIPGLGQLYGNQGLKKGLKYFIIGIIILIIFSLIASFMGIDLLYYIYFIWAIYSAYDSYINT
ncbi:MAG: hypothetical protein LBM96_04250 [Methanobrevibacter sp.]|nr:hypothetical protein [Candidatus Methanoflexus mossambicus]